MAEYSYKGRKQSMDKEPAAAQRKSKAVLEDRRTPHPPVQRQAAHGANGLPEDLKSGVESLSGMSLDHVKVHYNSQKPAQLNALAYAQGSEIHMGPGQAHHLPHEAWHLVQQAQGRVKPTMQMAGTPVNDEAALEREADRMGERALAAPAQRRELPAARAPSGTGAPAQLLIEGYKPGKLQARFTVMSGLDDQQMKKMQELHNLPNKISREDARKMVGAAAQDGQSSSGMSVPFPFRYNKSGEHAMETFQNDGGGFVQYPSTGLPGLQGHGNQMSLVSGSAYDDLQKGSKRNVTQSAVMGNVSPNAAAKALKLGDGAWEWLHLVAFSIKQTHVSSVSAQSLKLMDRTNQPQQIRENLVLGSAGANTAMLTYESLIKNFMKERPNWTLDLFVSADIKHAKVDGVTIPVANRIDYHFQFRTEDGEVTPPVILAFSPLDPTKPTLEEFASVVENLQKFLESHPVKVEDFKGMQTDGFMEV